MQNAKKIIRAAGYTIQPAGFWADESNKIPVLRINKQYEGGISIGGNRRQLGRQIKRFANYLTGRV
jgi:hypothetical protein